VRKIYIGNHKSDIYSLGIVMFEVIMGTHPYLAVEKWGDQQSMNLII
jgi:DNA-binding helix-hairpin-helix protein with protein kinase domain